MRRGRRNCAGWSFSSGWRRSTPDMRHVQGQCEESSVGVIESPPRMVNSPIRFEQWRLEFRGGLVSI